MEYLYGLQPVLAALKSPHRRIFQLLLYERAGTSDAHRHAVGDSSGHLGSILKLAQDRNIRLQYTTRTQLDALCEQRPHQVFAGMTGSSTRCLGVERGIAGATAANSQGDRAVASPVRLWPSSLDPSGGHY